ncbi:MAG: hypothetical protein QM802_17320 [Agriterribacter sp.]
MQKIELSNNQYRLLMQLVFLGIEVIDNAALGDDEDGDDDAPFLKEATELENFLMEQHKRFGVKDVVEFLTDRNMTDYRADFAEECEAISSAAYLNKAAELASFQMGIRDIKEAKGEDALEGLPAQKGVDDIMHYSNRYLEEIFENGFTNFQLKPETSAKIITLS